MAYSEEEKDRLFNEVCQRIIEGESVTSICRPNGGVISKPLFFEMVAESTEKANQYARACEARADHIFDQVLHIADSTKDDIITDPDTGFDVVNHNVIQRDRLRVDARKWALSKMNPKKYGDKIQTEHTGELGITWHEVKTYAPNDQAD